jgi:cytochrome c2
MPRSRIVVFVLLASASIPAGAQETGDAAAGQAYFEAECAECHRVAKLTGERGSEFIAAAEAIAAGKARHRPKIKLTPDAAADVKAFLQKAD